MWVTQTGSYYMPATGPKALTMPNGSTVTFTANAIPSANQPHVVCTTPAGAPMLMEWDYDGTTWGKLVVTSQDRTQWVFAGGTYNTQPLSQIVDRNGNAITFNYNNGKLSSITNSAGTNLLTLTRDNNGYVSGVSDCYNRSIYYTVGTFPGSWYELTQVSQIVPTGTVNPPLRYTYGYTMVANTYPFLGTMTVPSPTGTGTSTATINYTSYGWVSSTQDANGNTHTYSTVDNSHRRVTVADSLGHTVFSYVGRYDNSMSGTGITDGNGNLTSSSVYADSNDPYRPSSMSDGNGSAVSPQVQQGHTGTFSSTGNDQPAPRQWDIQYNNGIVAIPASMAGWTVNLTGTPVYPGYPQSPMNYTITVTAPANAPIGNYYSAHYTTGGSPAYASANFDVVAPGGSTTTGHPIVPQGATVTFSAYGNTAPSSPNWDIIRGGTVVVTSDGPSGWTVSAPNVTSNNYSSANFTVSAPATATVASGYEVRYTTLVNNYYTTYLSGILDVVAPGVFRKGTTALTWDQWGNCTSSTDPRGITTTYTYEYTNFAMGELTQVQVGTKSPTTYTYYEPSGLSQSETGPLPGTVGSNQTVTTSYTYDTLGNVLTKTEPGNNSTNTITTTYNYTSDGGYNQPASLGKPLTITDNLGHVAHFRYDNRGNKTSNTDPLGNEADETFNIADQPVMTTFPATGQTGTGHATSVNTFLYSGGPRTAVTDYDESAQQVRQVTTAYGAEGETLSESGSTEPVSYTYDALYRKKTLSDGKGNLTTYTYNVAGYLSGMTYPGGDTLQYTQYDANGNLLKRIDGNNVETDYLYNDPESQLTDMQYPASPAINVHFTYDGYGRRTSMNDGTGTTGYNYGDSDESLSVLTTYTGLPTLTLSYTYYPNGSTQQMNTPAGVFTYAYDGDGRLTSLTNPFNETPSWTYLNNDWEATQTLPNGILTVPTYNARHMKTELRNSIGGATLSDFGGANGTAMQYDAIGNRTTMAANVPASSIATGTTSYTYNNKNELLQEQSARIGGYTNNFGYDAAFNPTSFKGSVNSFNVNNQNTSVKYNGNGNPTSRTGTALTFDPENRLTSYGNVMSAGYNGDNIRVWKQNASGRTYFLNNNGDPVCEIGPSGAVTAVNTFGASDLVSRHTTAGSVFYSFDPQGSVSQTFDSTGAVLSSSLFDAFGNRLTAASNDPWGYQAQSGYYSDFETGLQLCLFRYYDPAQGRFLTRDPSGYDGGVNLYAYCGNSVIRGGDPTGLAKIDADCSNEGIVQDAQDDAYLDVTANAFGCGISLDQRSCILNFLAGDEDQIGCEGSNCNNPRTCGSTSNILGGVYLCLKKILANPSRCGASNRPNLSAERVVELVLLHELMHSCGIAGDHQGNFRNYSQFWNPAEKLARCCMGIPTPDSAMKPGYYNFYPLW